MAVYLFINKQRAIVNDYFPSFIVKYNSVDQLSAPCISNTSFLSKNYAFNRTYKTFSNSRMSQYIRISGNTFVSSSTFID